MLNLSDYKLFIFDLDNTIVSSEAQHSAAFAQAMRELAGYELTPDDYHFYIGNTSGELAKRIIEHNYFLDLTPDMVSDRKDECLMRNFVSKPYPGVLDFINLAAGHVLLAVASNSRRFFVHHVLKDIGIFPLFHDILTIEDARVRKPDPGILFSIAERNNLSPASCLVFEDSDIGLQTCANGNFPAVLLVNPGNILPDTIPDGIPTMTWPQLHQLASDNFA